MNTKQWGQKLLPKKKETLFVLFLAGVLLLILAMPTSQKKDSEKTKEKTQDTCDYEQQLEEKLTALLSEIEGAGEVAVMVTVADSGESVMGKDARFGEKDSEESAVYEEEGQDKRPFVVNSKAPKVQGVVVVCEGGGNPLVKQRISEAIEALFQIESHKISIVKKKE